MFYRRFLLFFLLTCLSLRAFPAVFVVTSNADSGPGTLRDALTQAAANGSAEKDYINFNLPDLTAAGRTILLITQLPDVSSNLVIDGTTQPGLTFGQSNAHVKISTPFNDSQFAVFNGFKVTDIEFYGLYIYDHLISRALRYAINLQHSSHIVIGGVDKGNLIKGFNVYSIFFEYNDLISVKSNVIGLTETNDLSDGVTGGLYFLQSSNISIGGPTLAEGNTIFTGVEISFDGNQAGGIINIASNNFGVFKNAVTGQVLLSPGGLSINTLFVNEFGATPQELATCATATVTLDNNELGTNFIGFRINGIKGSIDITKNYLGIQRDRVTPINFSHYTTAAEGNPIHLSNCSAQINIGNANVADGNFIAYADAAINAANCGNVFVRNNEFQCISLYIYGNDNADGTLPKVAITDVNSTGTQSIISGTSDAGALIDIYSSETCTYSQCSIRKHIQTVTADNAGKWVSGVFNLNGIFYVSSTVGNRTSEYETFQINSDKVLITNLRCNNTASITGLQVPNGISYYWTDQNGSIISHNLDLTTSTPGKYQLHLAGGCITSDVYEIIDDRIVVYDNSLVKTDASCGTNTGSIKNLFVGDPLFKTNTETWKDATGTIVGNALDITGLAAGSYTLTVNTSDGCTSTYGPVIIKNTNGPNIDQTQLTVQSTACGQSSGSITNLITTGTGALKYIWWDEHQQTVGTAKDLLNQPAGTYQLQVTDGSQCGAVYSAYITIPETNGITLDESKAQTKIASCSKDNGFIMGITATGATQYQWVDANNKIVGTNADLQNAAPGDYILTASNNFCSKTSKTYHIGQQAPTQFPAYPFTMVPACFGKNNGSVTVAADILVNSARWVDGQGQNVGGNGPSITGMAAGTYQLYLTDANGCESFYHTYTISTTSQLQILPGSEQVTNDQCGLKTASIKGIQVTGGLTPYTWKWLDANNNIVSSSADLSNIGAGVYSLNVSDASGCDLASADYTVQDQNAVIPPLL